MEQWMAALPVELKNRPLNRLIMPGTHDSCTYDLRLDLPVARDEPKWLQDIGHSLTIREVIKRWSQCQDQTVTQQLSNGIRLLDLRTEKYPNSEPGDTGAMYHVHGLYGHRVGQTLLEVHDFLDKNKEEVVLLSFNSTHFFDSADHKALLDLIQTVCGTFLCPPCKYTDATLNRLVPKNHRLIALYPNCGDKRVGTEVWPHGDIQSSWANTTSVDYLIRHMTDWLASRDVDRSGFYQSNGDMTEDADWLIKHPLESQEAFSAPACKAVLKWLGKLSVDQLDKMNIVTLNYTHKYGFEEAVVKLNYKRISRSDVVGDFEML